MQVTRNDLNPCTVELKVVCNSEVVRTGFQKAYKDFAKDKKIKVPGFRSGQTPIHLIQKLVSEEDARRGAVKHIVNDVSKEAIKQQDLEVFERPHVSVDKIDQESLSCEITIKVPLAPIVELGDYKNLEIEAQDIQVSQEEIDKAIESIKSQFSERKMIEDRAAQDDDVVVINLKAGSKASRPIVVIIGKSFDQLNEALLGMNVGETKKAEITFPEETADKELAGKTLDCEIQVESISAFVSAELTDEFVQGLKDSRIKSENVAEFNEKVKLEVQSNKEKEVRDAMAEDLLSKLMEISTVHVPDTLWETVVEHRVNEIAYISQKNNVPIEKIIQDEVGHSDVEMFLEELKKDAKLQVERAIVARDIFTREDLKISESDMTEALLDMCKDYNVDLKTLYENLQRSNRMHEAQFRAIFNKVLQFLLENTDSRKKELKEVKE